MAKNIFFDLDGTIINSSKGIVNGYKVALNYFNIKANDDIILNNLIGPSLKYGFTEIFKLDDVQADLAIEKFREYYSTVGVEENSLYKGIDEVLKKLKNQNKTIILATSKPEVFAKRILEKHKIIQYFDFVSGATLDETRHKKTDIIKYAINNLKIKDCSECIMVGDKRYDIEGAKDNKMKSIGVTYGFGTKEELENAGATYIVNNPIEIIDKVN